MLKVGGLSASGPQRSRLSVSVLFRGNKKRTGLSEEEQNVRWNDRLDFKLKGNPLGAKSSLQLQLKENVRSGKGRLIGSTVVQLGSLVGEKSKILTFKQIPLMDKNKQKTKNTISFDIFYESPTANKNQKLDEQLPSVTNITGIQEPKARPQSLPPEQDAVRGTSRFTRNISNKSQDFQVRIRIIEGRHLHGVNIRPVVKLYVGDSAFRTRIRRGNNPVFDEIFFQNFHKTPSEVFNTSIHIQVLNSHSLRSDSMIGVFKLDIGSVYDFPGHAVLRKWLLLYEVDDTHSMAKGYLKVSIIVLAVGDEAPIDKKGTNEEDDVESNLLQSAGVLSRWVTFILKIYRAEDISHMTRGLMTNLKHLFGADSDKKDGVDSFLEVSFAGSKVSTKVVENQINPEWNQVIYLRSRFPSLSENIRFTVYDRKSAIKSKPLGTTHLNISKISSMEQGVEDEDIGGYLPAFGPCFLNLYGSPREGLDGADKDDEFNLGKIEGVSYRGRILVELIIRMEEHLGNNIDNLSAEDSLIVQKYLHRRRYSLCVIFYSATQLQDTKEPIQFEVSMGNYGNRLDKSCKLHASTTQYSQPVFDGNHYYYLLWCDAKPVAALTSYWENIDHRLDRLNILLKIIDRLKTNLENIKQTMPAEGARLTGSWLKMLDHVVKDCSQSLPSVKRLPNVTVLDQYLYNQQVSTLKKIRKSAEKLRDKAVDVQDKLSEVEDWIERLTSVAVEPQNSLPDIIIWMLCGEKRVAYARIKAQSVLFSSDDRKCCGKCCGKLQTVFMKYPLDKMHEMRTAAQVHLWIWLGLSSDEEEFEKLIDGKFMIAAERYENQAKVMGHWGTSGLLHHPIFSDAMGKIRLSKRDFYPLKGWQWDGKWTIDPEQCLLFDPDAGHSEFIDDVYENEYHLSGGEWSPAFEHYTDVKGNRHRSMEEIECPDGWEWKEEWNIDLYRAVDENGWEYGRLIPPDKLPKTWNPTEKAYHTHRRRRWVRRRTRRIESYQIKEEDFDPDGWEYAPLFGWKFHVKPNTGDTFRRRRWRRKMIPKEQLGPASIFRLEGSLCRENIDATEDEFVTKEKPNENHNLYGLTAPFITCLLDPPTSFQLRGYIYQARGLLPTDRSNFADPYVQMSFLYQSKKTAVIKSTVSPTWDQTLIVENIEIYGNLREIVENPPCIMLEMFDSNRVGKHEYMGGTLCYPSVKLDSSLQYIPVLHWYPVFKEERFSGELLFSCELFLKQKVLDEDQNLPPRPPMKDSEILMVPPGIRPQLQMTIIEILAWGLRNLKNYNMLRVTSPSLVVECSGEMIQTPPIKNYRKNPNFPSSTFFITVFLPIDPMYSPPIVIKVMDYRAFGYRPVVGQSSVKSLSEFICDPYAGSGASEVTVMRSTASFHVESPNIESSEEEKLEQEATEGHLEVDSLDWWCKFYASLGEQNEYSDYLLLGYDTIKVYPCALEDVPQFKGLQDFCNTFRLYRGKVYGEVVDPLVVGEFKGSFRIYPIPEDPSKPLPPAQFRQLPSSEPQVCLVRVYIVRALSLQPKDRNGTCDPYTKVSLGKVLVDDREHYVPNTINPVFGRMFQLYATIPLNKDLKVEVFDYDMITQDDKIGETVIDLENRFLSCFGAHCGLPQTYCTGGPTQWRDQLKPTELLNNLSKLKNYALPIIHNAGKKISIGDREFLLEDFEAKKVPYAFPGPPEERLALHILRLQNLVPEHVETRTLFNSIQPGIEQGKIQMWIDIFPKNLGPPGPPFNITPRAPTRYVLRCIVWNTNDVVLQETSVMGEKMSDIYVKGWIAGLEDNTQKTDVHYRSLDGEGNFNWRFIFPFEYIKVERVLVVSKKNYIWNLDEMDVKMPPKLIIQLWDNDKFSFDDHLGYLELNLNALRSPTKWSDNCTLNRFFKKEGSSSDDLQKLVSLFKQKSVKGWWPCITYKEGKPTLTGKIELTLELVTDIEAEERPSGKGREEPNMNPKLEPPNRPDTSFLWFRSPLKGLKHIVWRKYKWWVVCTFLLVVPVIFLISILNALPSKDRCITNISGLSPSTGYEQNGDRRPNKSPLDFIERKSDQEPLKPEASQSRGEQLGPESSSTGVRSQHVNLITFAIGPDWKSWVCAGDETRECTINPHLCRFQKIPN
ncbi:myoferlin-like isoform X3 [Narcine bancroftii]|uniref:myoferlin-like isoform X3 n=1 Tax=Narcine bancroftii TaxID=1343680 RepID=UPI003831AC94